jgi:nitrite reductase (NO-forming)
MVRRSLATAAAVAAIAVAAAGCGSSSGGGAYSQPTGPPVKTISIQASSFKFVPNKITAPAGILEFKLTSEDIQHSFRIKNVNGFMIETSGGKTATGKVKLAAGTYTFYCDIPGHESAGMKGTLTVK